MSARLRQRAHNQAADFQLIRVAADVSQRDLAELSGVAERSIQNFERGIADIRLGNFTALVNALGYDLKLERRK